MPLAGSSPEPCGGAFKFTAPTPTAIAEAGTPVKAAGTTAVHGSTSQMIAVIDNRLSMICRRRRLMAAHFKGHVDISTRTDTVAVRIYKNGEPIEGAGHAVIVKAKHPAPVDIEILTQMVVGDFLEMYVETLATTADVTLIGQLQVIG